MARFAHHVGPNASPQSSSQFESNSSAEISAEKIKLEPKLEKLEDDKLTSSDYASPPVSTTPPLIATPSPRAEDKQFKARVNRKGKLKADSSTNTPTTVNTGARQPVFGRADLDTFVRCQVPIGKRALCLIVRQKSKALTSAKAYFYPTYHLFLQAIQSADQEKCAVANSICNKISSPPSLSQFDAAQNEEDSNDDDDLNYCDNDDDDNDNEDQEDGDTCGDNQDIETWKMESGNGKLADYSGQQENNTYRQQQTKLNQIQLFDDTINPMVASAGALLTGKRRKKAKT